MADVAVLRSGLVRDKRRSGRRCRLLLAMITEEVPHTEFQRYVAKARCAESKSPPVKRVTPRDNQRA